VTPTGIAPAVEPAGTTPVPMLPGAFESAISILAPGSLKSLVERILPTLREMDVDDLYCLGAVEHTGSPTFERGG
jgi:hypothetical protein